MGKSPFSRDFPFVPFVPTACPTRLQCASPTRTSQHFPPFWRHLRCGFLGALGVRRSCGLAAPSLPKLLQRRPSRAEMGRADFFEALSWRPKTYCSPLNFCGPSTTLTSRSAHKAAQLPFLLLPCHPQRHHHESQRAAKPHLPQTTAHLTIWSLLARLFGFRPFKPFRQTHIWRPQWDLKAAISCPGELRLDLRPEELRVGLPLEVALLSADLPLLSVRIVHNPVLVSPPVLSDSTLLER